ncbi:molybdenum cofactor guanylyltransferase [Sphingomonas sp.]|uniref:molybdenum cofactor guanylyltransferase n=1 Tax=Sphingomonas sp. TaxID=28214 RepID=UPI0025DA8BCE|nr:molybdenum cofactor guanylyltransferase [Sphingomonas sp.]
MRILGAIIAGGQSLRFGSDKAHALLDGRRLIEIVALGLKVQVEASVVCGRTFEDLIALRDRPVTGLGPLGGLCAALHLANFNGYDAVLSVAADIVPIPPQLAEWLVEQSDGARRPAVIKGQHLIGLWPAALSERLDQYLQTPLDRSLRSWIAACGAIPISVPVVFTNINSREDLQRAKA